MLVAGAYEAMAHFDLFAAQAMLYFATVSFAEVSQRLPCAMTMRGLERLPRRRRSGARAAAAARASSDSRHHAMARRVGYRRRAARVRRLDARRDRTAQRRRVRPTRRGDNLYPVDFDVLIERHDAARHDARSSVAALPRCAECRLSRRCDCRRNQRFATCCGAQLPPFRRSALNRDRSTSRLADDRSARSGRRVEGRRKRRAVIGREANQRFHARR